MRAVGGDQVRWRGRRLSAMRRGQADDLLKVIFKTTRYQTEEEAALKLNRNLGARRQGTVGRFDFPTHIITVLDQGG